MAKKSPDVVPSDPDALTHSPFAAVLARNSSLRSKIVQPARPADPVRPAPRISMFVEARGRSGKVVTGISGLPPELRDVVVIGLRKALGCEAEVEGEYVILAGSLKERATAWFAQIGDVRRLLQNKPAPASAAPSAAPAAPPTPSTSASGTRRKDVRPGLRVAIVLKPDQPTGELTHGVVRDILTSSSEHPHGIKVRLVSGQVGRVKEIYR
jgi:uncharacterized repeat protein (TIGR03833 family)